MQIKDIIIHNTYGLGIIKSLDSEQIGVYFINNQFINLKRYTNILDFIYIIPESFCDYIINLSYSMPKYDSYKYSFNKEGLIQAKGQYASQVFSPKPSTKWGKQFENTILYSLSILIKHLYSTFKYTKTKNDNLFYIQMIRDFERHFFDFDLIINLKNLISNIDNTNALYNLYMDLNDNDYRHILLINIYHINKDLFATFYNDIAYEPAMINQISRLYRFLEDGLYYYQYKMSLLTLEAVLSNDYFHLLDVITNINARGLTPQILNILFNNVVNKASLDNIEQILNRIDFRRFPNFTKALLTKYNYQEYSYLYDKYKKNLDLSEILNDLPLESVLANLTPNQEGTNYLVNNFDKIYNYDKKTAYNLLFKFKYLTNQLIEINSNNQVYNELLKSKTVNFKSLFQINQVMFKAMSSKYDLDEVREIFDISVEIVKLNQIYSLKIVAKIGDIVVLDFFSYEPYPSCEGSTIINNYNTYRTLVYAINEIVRKDKEYSELIDEYNYKLANFEREKLIEDLRSELDDFTNMLTNSIPLTLTNNEKVVLYPKLVYYYKQFSLELSIGRLNDRKYVVKDIAKLLEDFYYKRFVSYGKNLAFSHIVSNLVYPSNKLYEYLADININNGKSLELNNARLRQILNILDNTYIEFDGKYYLYLNEPYIPSISIDKNYEITIDGIDNLDYYILEDEDILIFNELNNTLQFVDRDKIALYLFCFKNHDRSFKLIKDEFIKRVYYPNNELITIDDELKDTVVVPNISIDAYFDYDKGNILLNTKYYLNTIEQDDILEYDYTNKIATYQNYIKKLGFIDNKIIDQEMVINFLTLDFSSLRELCNVYLSDSIKGLTVRPFSKPSINISYNANMMECCLKDSIYSEEELIKILKAIKQKKKYVLLNDNTIHTFNPDDYNFYDEVNDLGLNEDLNGTVEIPIYTGIKAIKEYENIEYNNLIDSMLDDVVNYNKLDIALPNIKAELRNYQIDGYKWLKTLNSYHLGGILADDMGLGKTLEVITLLASLELDKPTLIVTPKSLIFNWLSEIKRFSDLKATSIYGMSSNRHKLIASLKPGHIYLTSYESLSKDVEIYQSVEFSYLILDEASAIKNFAALKTKSVKQLKADYKLALTGTPIENNILELWSIFDFLMPNFLPKLSVFKEQYKDELGNLALKIKPFVLRRRKKDVLKDLPPKTETIMTVELDEGAQKYYDSLIYDLRQMLKDDKNQINILAYLMRLRQICVSPATYIENYNKTSSKIKMLLDLVNQYIPEGHKILVFSQFVEALKLVAKELDDNNISYYMLTGQTEANERIELVNSFNEDPNIKVFLISLKAGGVGLNLVGADTVIHLDPWWNIAAENQASDRAHRIGQVHSVEVIKLICDDTIEQKVIELQNIKKDIIDKVIDNDMQIADLSRDDLMYILS